MTKHPNELNFPNDYPGQIFKQQKFLQMKKVISLLIVLLVINSGIRAQPTVGSWLNTGPVPFPINVSGQVNGMGRVSQIKFHPSLPGKMYAVSSSGGLFITTDTGRTWRPTPGTEVLPTTACSAVCIDYTNDSVLYLSTGDQNYYGDWYGIYKSTDGGNTWNPAHDSIGTSMAVDIIMDPASHNTIVAATDNGIWKSTDGATTWRQTLDSGQMRSMQKRPGTSRVLYAATGTSFFRSADFGSTWTMITSGVNPPAGNEGMRIAVTPADTNMVYLGTTGGYGEIMKSMDGGNTFSTIYTNDTQCIVCYDSTVTSGSQGYYNFNFCVNPLNPNELLLGSHCVWRSTDGGLTWSWRTQWWHQIHTDMHDLQFDPYIPNLRWNANDGGVWISHDTLATNWSPNCNGLAATEMYHSSQDPINRQLVAAGCQDNGELYYDGHWKCDRGGDWGARQNSDYLGKGTVYYDNGNRRDLSPLGGDYSYNAPFTTSNQFNIEFSPRMTTTAFIGTDSIWRTRNINAASPAWQFLYTAGEDIMSLTINKADTNSLFAVTNNNHFLRCNNALAATPSFTQFPTPSSTGVEACVTTNRYNGNIVYLSCGDSLYRSANRGLTWSNISYNLPGLNIRKIISDDYSTTERLFVCAGSYVFYKDSATTHWTQTSGLPTVANLTDMLVYNDSTSASILRLSTYGRGAWECNIFNNYPPSGNFASTKQYLCAGDTVKYGKNLYGSISSFSWSFPGGTPATSVLDSPVVVYPATGAYDAYLYATGAHGTDTIHYVNYINVAQGDTGTINEGFEEASFPPSAQWTQISQSGLPWLWTDSVGGYGASLHSISFNNFNNDAGGRHDRIVMPRIDLTHALTAQMYFDVAYSYYPGYRDSLLVDVSTDCERSWTTVYCKDTTVLATAPDTTQYFNPSATEWRTDTISLNSFIGNSIEIAFDNVGHYGQLIYIDNINLHMTLWPLGTSVPNNLDPVISLYPNPAKDICEISCKGITGDKLSVSVTDILGKVISGGQQINVNQQALSYTLEVQRWAPGVYFVTIVEESGRSWVRKLIVE